jgi:pimeloyl-ACP methyl ester carboxylesterase
MFLNLRRPTVMMRRPGILTAAALCIAIVSATTAGAKDTAPVAKPAQPLVGHWAGALKIGAVSLRLVVSVTAKPDGSYSGTLNSVDQDATPHPLSEVSLKQNAVHIAFKQAGLVIDGTLNEAGTEIAGKFKQGPATFPIVFKKTDRAPEGPKRPQEPKPPFPYRAEEVTYENTAAHAKFAGTLTIPRGPGRYPAVLLITGSGQQNRDEQLLGHRPFLVLADYLTRHGIAVLRVDDRGVGGSTGDVAHATSEDFAGDVLAGVAFLKMRSEIDPHKIGLIGHSEGGLIAPVVANRSSDVAFIVLLAGPGLPGDEIVLMQGEFLLKQAGASEALIARTRTLQKKLYAAVKEEHDAAALSKRIKEIYHEYLASLTPAQKAQSGVKDETAEMIAKQLGSPWFRYFLTYDPRPALTRVKCPVLALIGEKDMQVPPKANIPELEKALRAGGNKDFTVRELPHLNHLFQTCKNGSVTEYAKIEETFSPTALEIIGKWIREHTSGNAASADAGH